MFRWIIINALLYSIAHQTLGEPSNETIFSRIIETQLPNPVTLVIDSDLYTISKANETLRINSTSNVNCTFVLSPLENIEGRINAIAYEFISYEKKIVVFGIEESHDVDNFKLINYTLLIVDPLACTYEKIPLPVDQIPTSWPIIQPQVIAIEYAYFIVYPSQQYCDPCQFMHYTGLDSTWQNHMPHHGVAPSSQFYLKLFPTFFPNDALLYAYNFANGTAMLQIVDTFEFKDANLTLLLNTTVDAVSVSQGPDPNIAVCSISSDNRREVKCMRLKKKWSSSIEIIKMMKSWKLPLKDNLPVSNVSVFIEKVGNTFIGIINSQGARMFIYDRDGHMLADLDFGKLEEKYTHREVNSFRLGNEFCLALVVYSDLDVQDVRHIVKCVELTKYLSGQSYIEYLQ